MENKVPQPQPQTLQSCFSLREECQKAIFSKMEELHGEQMKSLAEIKEQMAFAKGQASMARAGRGLFFQFLFNWGPFLAFLLVLGVVKWFGGKL